MKDKAQADNRSEPTTLRADRGEILPLPELEVVLDKIIMNTNKGSSFAGNVDDSNGKHLRPPKAKGLVEKIFSRLNLHHQS